MSIESINMFAEYCIEYNKEHNIDITQFEMCPVHLWASQHNASCHNIHSGIENCKLCGEPICPACGNHNITQVSRVTGYMGDVGGWNEAKKQELIDRKRYDI